MSSEYDTVFVDLRINNDQNPSLTQIVFKSTKGFREEKKKRTIRKRFFVLFVLGWSTGKFLLVGLIALCILGIILAAIFFVISKKFKKNQRTTTSPGSTTTTKAVVTKGVSPDPKYQPVPNV